MAWITRRRDELKYCGRLTRPRSFESWADGEGRHTVNAVASHRWFALFGKQRAAKKEIWRELQQRAETGPLASRIQATVNEYVDQMGGFGLDRPSLPRATVELRRLVTIPRALYNAWALGALTSRLRAVPEAADLKGGVELMKYFSFELINAVDQALAASPPSVQRPLQVSREWSIVGLNPDFVWSVPFGEGPNWRGHYFVYETPFDGFTRARRKQLAAAIENLDAGLGDLTRVRKSAILAERPVSAR